MSKPVAVPTSFDVAGFKTKFQEAEAALYASFNRPLTQKDYYDARHGPLDEKFYGDFVGPYYLARHGKRNWRSKKRLRGSLQIAAGAAVLLPMMLSPLPLVGICQYYTGYPRKLFREKPRSAAGTREDTVCRALRTCTETAAELSAAPRKGVHQSAVDVGLLTDVQIRLAVAHLAMDKYFAESEVNRIRQTTLDWYTGLDAYAEVKELGKKIIEYRRGKKLCR